MIHRENKNSFESKYKCIFAILCIVCAMLVWSCNNANDQPLIDEQISSNLLKKGTANPVLLIGEWDCIKFAYTANGKKISKEVPATPTFSIAIIVGRANYSQLCSHDGELYVTIAFANHVSCYSISNNLINWSHGFRYVVDSPITDDEAIILNILKHAYSFAVNGDELIIYFTGEENKNLLIFEKDEH